MDFTTVGAVTALVVLVLGWIFFSPAILRFFGVNTDDMWMIDDKKTK